MNINININKDGLTDQDIDKVLDALETINYDDIVTLCDGSEMQFSGGLISIKIQDNKDYQPMVITTRDNLLGFKFFDWKLTQHFDSSSKKQVLLCFK